MIRLVSITPNAEKTIAYCARVSNPNNQENESYKSLLKYCIRHSHWSVFEQASATIEITTSRTIARQLLRHRSFCFQEFSQRYACVPNTPLFFKARSPDPNNRQNSLDNVNEFTSKWFEFEQKKVWNTAYDSYLKAISRGIAKEQARAILPEGMTPTTLYMTGNMRSWLHFCQVRTASGSQKEIEILANEIKSLLKNECPTIYSLV